MARDFGSRAWNLDSKWSDHDIAFVFRQDPIEYAQVSEYQQSIDRDSEHEGVKHTFMGWNLKRFMNLLHKSNPSTIEFLNSDVNYIYGDSHWQELTEYVNQHFKPIAMMGHYHSMAKSNYEKYLKPEKDPSLKRNLYVVRALLYKKWIAETHQVPPLDFIDFLENHLREITYEHESGEKLITRTAEGWAQMKKEGRGNEEIGNPLQEWIEEELEKGPDPEGHDVRGIEKEVVNRHIRKSFSGSEQHSPEGDNPE